ncbi:MAG: hypothetical protein WKF89_14320 [Chitinophagaceae bacterium]
MLKTRYKYARPKWFLEVYTMYAEATQFIISLLTPEKKHGNPMQDYLV